VNVGSAGTRPLGTGLPAVEVVSAWRRGRSTVSAGEPRTRSGDEPSHRESPQLTVEAVEQRAAGSERGMGKHACRKAGRCALSLLYGVAAGACPERSRRMGGRPADHNLGGKFG
jgi:hypothetical protein